MNKLPHQKIVDTLKQGGIIAYPTEAVYGFGCDPLNKQAVYKILELKQRSADKGLILIAASWEQVKNFTAAIPAEKLQQALKPQPTPTTWIFPASPKAPTWITGNHETIAIRITAHPIAKKICRIYNSPIVSTSANIEGQLPCKTYEEVKNNFGDKIDLIIPGNVGDLEKPTSIKDILSNKTLR